MASTDLALREEYRYLQAFAEVGGKSKKEIAALLKQAYEEHAPYDAIFKRPNSGIWATFRSHCSEGYGVSNEIAKIFARNQWGKPVHSEKKWWQS